MADKDRVLHVLLCVVPQNLNAKSLWKASWLFGKTKWPSRKLEWHLEKTRNYIKSWTARQTQNDLWVTVAGWKNISHYILPLMVWYWWAYSSRFSLCFIVNFGRRILFLRLIFSLFKCLLIVLVLQGESTRYFNIFYVNEVFFFSLQTILLLNCGDNFSGLLFGFLFPYLFGLFK